MSWAYALTDGQMANRALRDYFAQSNSDTKKKTWKPFQPEGTPPVYTRDRVVEIKHIKLKVKLELQSRSIQATATLTIIPIVEDVQQIELDAIGLKVSSVSVGKQKIEFENTGSKLLLHFMEPLPIDEPLEVQIVYRARPQRGLYFIRPNENDPQKHPEVWSQGQDEDSRYWFPCFDYPSQKATSELIATVPGNWFCLSNGTLLERKENKDGSATFHWVQERPHSSYLITLCAGEYVEIADSWDGIPVNYYVPPGREEDGARSFGKTPKMVAFYSKLIGVRYPFSKYAQITATDFIFGGMENTTATTQTERTLHDAKAHRDFSSEPLVAHELVHSWFGDLLTCRDWSHAWLNESFATYFDNLWYLEDRGVDDFRYELYGDWKAYLDEDKSHYRRPLVTNVYRAPMDLFDRHLYQKGACILHYLRNILGDRLFFKAIKLYVERFSDRSVITQDLINALEDATGRNFEWFFEQWIFKGGHPEIEFSSSWDANTKVLTLTVKQTQTPDELTGIFRLPLKIRAVGKNYDRTFSCLVTADAHTFYFEDLPARPTWLAFDPGNTVPKTLTLKLDEDQLIAQLKADDDVMGRVYAAQALADKATRNAVEALSSVLSKKSTFWGVQAEAAAALGKIRSDEAKDALVAALYLPHPKARRAVVRALGIWRDPELEEKFKTIAEQDESYFVQAEAATALGKLRTESAFKSLLTLLEEPSWQDVIRVGVFEGLVESDVEKAFPVLLEWTAANRSVPSRCAALRLLGKAAYEADRERYKNQARKVLEQVLDEGFFLDRIYAMQGLTALKDRTAIGALERFQRTTHDSRLQRDAEETIEGLRSAGGAVAEVQSLRSELDKLKTETANLRSKLEKLEAVKSTVKNEGRKRSAQT